MYQRKVSKHAQAQSSVATTMAVNRKKAASHPLLQMQRQYGNRFVGRFLSNSQSQLQREAERSVMPQAEEEQLQAQSEEEHDESVQMQPEEEHEQTAS